MKQKAKCQYSEMVVKMKLLLIFTCFLLGRISAQNSGLESVLGEIEFGELPDGKVIENTIRDQIGTIKSIMLTGDPENGVPPLDPYLQTSNDTRSFQVDTYFAQANVTINNVKVSGLSNFDLTSLKVDVEGKSIKVGLEVPHIELTGDYSVLGSFQLNGPVAMTGSGPFEARLLSPKIEVFLNMAYDNKTLSVAGSMVEVDYEDLDFNLQGFMTGSPLAPIILRAIKYRSREHFDEKKEEIETRIGDFMVSTVNTILEAMTGSETVPDQDQHVINKRQACGSANMNQYIDQVLKNARPIIRAKADPLRLKDLKKVVKLYDGRVTGLSSIRRTGNVILSCTSSKIDLLVNFGFGRVSAGYRWKRRLLFVKLKGKAEIRFKSLDVSAKISQSRKPGAHPVINNLDLKLRGVSVRVSGLSIAGHIIAAIISLISNVFRRAVANALEKPIKKALQNELNKITLPF